MMEKIIALILLINILSVSYAQEFKNQSHPYLKTRVKEVKPPASINDAINQLELVLKNEIINYFKNSKEDLATTEISRELSDFFVNNWHLLYKGSNSIINIGIANPFSDLVNEFSNYGLNNPDLIMKIIFSCFHKKLNNENFIIENEINDIKKSYDEKVFNINSQEDYLDARTRIKAFEDSILLANNLSKYHINDTIGRWYYETKRKSSFYITSVIINMDSANKKISTQIIDITSDKRYHVVLYNDNLLKINDIINDTININMNNWYKLNDSVFNYYYGELRIANPEWNKYINLKYHAN